MNSPRFETLETSGIQPGDVISIVGAGGKTSLMFFLARKLPFNCLTTTTTKIGKWQALQSDYQGNADDFFRNPSLFLSHKSSWVNPDYETASIKLSGFTPAEFSRIYEAARPFNIVILNEGDGAHMLHIKAPNANEPIIPSETTIVMAVVGLDTLGMSITRETVHRLDEFLDVTGSHVGDTVTEQVITALYSYPMGSFKDVTSLQKRIAVLNQADDEQHKNVGKRLADGFISGNIADEVWVTSLIPGKEFIEIYTPKKIE